MEGRRLADLLDSPLSTLPLLMSSLFGTLCLDGADGWLAGVLLIGIGYREVRLRRIWWDT